VLTHLFAAAAAAAAAANGAYGASNHAAQQQAAALSDAWCRRHLLLDAYLTMPLPLLSLLR
jgi:hypothetical protein